MPRARAHGPVSGPQAGAPARPARRRLLLAACLAAAAVGILLYRAYRTLALPPPRQHFRLAADVRLEPPPPLPGDDRARLRERLRALKPPQIPGALAPSALERVLDFSRTAARAG